MNSLLCLRTAIVMTIVCAWHGQNIANAAVTHAFLPELSANISKGAPEGAIRGPLSGVNSMTVDSKQLWVAEHMESGPLEGHSRVDSFATATGAFSSQLDEEGGVNELHFGIAVGHSAGEEQIYVGAGLEGKGVLAVFGVSGSLQQTWAGAHTPTGAFGQVSGVAVDSSANLETRGDIYVSSIFGQVDIFAPTAGGEEPKELVGQLTGTPSGPFVEPRGVAVSGANSDVLVADGNFSKCLSHEGECVIDVFEPVSGMPGTYNFLFKIAGTPQGPFMRIGPMAVDPASGHIYVADLTRNVVDEFDRQGDYLGRLDGTPTGPEGTVVPFHSVQSVAAETEGVFVGDFDPETRVGAVDAFGGDLVIPDVQTLPASEVSPESAQLNGTINPQGAGQVNCRFEWGPSEALGKTAPCSTVANGGEAVPVSATVTGLQPDVRYFYRLQASNENGTNTGDESPAECEGEASLDACFTTTGPGLHGQWVSELSSTGATLNASIDPHGVTTSYFFEYGLSSSYSAKVPASPLVFGSGQGDVHVAQQIQPLAPDTTYHYRVVRVSELGSFPGPDQTFTTQGAGGFVLPDGRRWELVTPAEKHGASLSWIAGAGIIQSAASGNALSYLVTLPTEQGVKGYGEAVQVIAARGEDGWVSHDISTPHGAAVGANTGNGPEYRFFSEDLSLGLVEPSGPFTSLSPEVFPPDTERTPYLRHDATCQSAPSDCYEPLLTGALGYADVPQGTQFGGSSNARLGEANFVDGASDLSHAVLTSALSLTSEPTGGIPQLYEWSVGRDPAEELQLVSELPHGGGPAKRPALLGYSDIQARHGISEDGSRIVWSEEAGHLYLHDSTRGQTVQLDAPEAKCFAAENCGSGQPAPRFQIASSNGARVFFTDSQRLTEDAGTLAGSDDLYECEMIEIGGQLQCRLSDLTPQQAGQSADVLGNVLGASEDGSYVYFVANGVLGDGAEVGAKPGMCPRGSGFEAQQRCNVYELSYDGVKWQSAHLIATLGGGDFPDWAPGGTLSTNGQTARVSADGHWLAFMSARSLTGYDNLDANSGREDEEVFLFHADNRLVICASCDPTGARPVGVEYEKLIRVAGVAVWPNGTWLAANVPAWTAYELQTARYQSRYLSDSGRLFFNSSDALVPQDINGNEDVYEYEPAGTGTCSATSRSFLAAIGGCVGLISSGEASGESAFLDASQNGSDVFFITDERLIAKDSDTAADIYDAHICSSTAPCVSEPLSPPPCETADACRASASPQLSIFSAPSTATFSGPGNLTQRLPPPPSLSRIQKLAKALDACRHRYKAGKARKRRIACERAVHRRYGAARPHRPKRGGR